MNCWNTFSWKEQQGTEYRVGSSARLSLRKGWGLHDHRYARQADKGAELQAPSIFELLTKSTPFNIAFEVAPGRTAIDLATYILPPVQKAIFSTPSLGPIAYNIPARFLTTHTL